MRQRKFTPSVEFMGLRLAPSGALPIDVPDPTVESTGPTENPLVGDTTGGPVHIDIPPMFCPTLVSNSH